MHVFVVPILTQRWPSEISDEFGRMIQSDEPLFDAVVSVFSGLPHSFTASHLRSRSFADKTAEIQDVTSRDINLCSQCIGFYQYGIGSVYTTISLWGSIFSRTSRNFFMLPQFGVANEPTLFFLMVEGITSSHMCCLSFVFGKWNSMCPIFNTTLPTRELTFLSFSWAFSHFKGISTCLNA